MFEMEKNMITVSVQMLTINGFNYRIVNYTPQVTVFQKFLIFTNKNKIKK